MMTTQHLLDFYAQPSLLTSAGRHAFLFAELPSDVEALVRIIQGLGIYDVVASSFYGCTIQDARIGEIHLRSIEQMLTQLLALDSQPLSVARTPDKRLACRCHNFTRFLVALLRAKGIPARSRCGFGTYFNKYCPQTYAYAYDDGTGLFNCPAAETMKYEVTFHCPR